jgi:hypothetical protein
MLLVRALSVGLIALGIGVAALWRSDAGDAWQLSATFSWLLACVVAGFLSCAHGWRLKLREDEVSPALATMETFDLRLLGRLDSGAPRLSDEWVRCMVSGSTWFALGLAGLAVFYYGHLAIVHG